MVEFHCLNIVLSRATQHHSKVILNQTWTHEFLQKCNGRHGSKYEIFYNVWQKAGDVSFSGSHSDYKILKIYHREKRTKESSSTDT